MKNVENRQLPTYWNMNYPPMETAITTHSIAVHSRFIDLEGAYHGKQEKEGDRQYRPRMFVKGNRFYISSFRSHRHTDTSEEVKDRWWDHFLAYFLWYWLVLKTRTSWHGCEEGQGDEAALWGLHRRKNDCDGEVHESIEQHWVRASWDFQVGVEFLG